MKRTRAILFFLVIFIILTSTYFVIQIARGYRPDLKTRTLVPTGLLVTRSIPKNANVYVNGLATGTTDTTANLEPGSYVVEVIKDLFHPWKKTLLIEKELVTQADILLFPIDTTPFSVRQLNATTASLSPDSNRLVFVAPEDETQESTPSPTISPTPGQAGLYSLDLSDSPLNLNRDPRIISSSTSSINWNLAQFTWSPDSRQLLVRIPRDARCTDLDRTPNPCPILGAYLMDPNRQSNQPVNIATTYRQLLLTWDSEEELRNEITIGKLPKILSPYLVPFATDFVLSPDNTKVMYTATASASIPDQIIPAVPAASTQLQNRNLEPGNVYIYDFIEDRNFLVGKVNLPKPTPTGTRRQTPTPTPTFSKPPNIAWFPSSRHVLLVSDDKINVVEYDGTNNLTLFEGSIFKREVYPSTSGNRLFLILTNTQNPLSPQLMQIDLKI